MSPSDPKQTSSVQITAKALGLSAPQSPPSRADEVIE